MGGPDRARGALLTVAAAVATVAIGALDVVTGPAYGLSLFYLMPIAATAWWVGRRPGLAIALLAAIAWFAADLLDRTPDTVVASGWNAFTRCVIFAGAVLLLAHVREQARYYEQAEAHRTQALQLLGRELPPRLDRLMRLAHRVGGRDQRGTTAARELADTAEELGIVSRRVLALALVPGGKRGSARVDLRDVTAAAVASVTAHERVVVASPPRPVNARADARLLELTLAELVAAALRLSPDPVVVTPRELDGRAHVEVAGPAAGERFREDDRSQRGAAAAASDVALALQLLRVAVQSQGGEVHFKDVDEGGWAVDVSLARA